MATEVGGIAHRDSRMMRRDRRAWGHGAFRLVKGSRTCLSNSTLPQCASWAIRWLQGFVLFMGSCGDPHVLSGYRSPMGMSGFRHWPHSGVDFAGDVGDPVIAAAPGVVLAVRFQSSVGNWIVLAHPLHGRCTLYAHLGSTLVVPGQHVRRGAPIGLVGLYPRSYGRSHVHLELRTSGCLRRRAHGDLRGTADPLRGSAGCFERSAVYPTDELVLTYPVRCN